MQYPTVWVAEMDLSGDDSLLSERVNSIEFRYTNTINNNIIINHSRAKMKIHQTDFTKLYSFFADIL